MSTYTFDMSEVIKARKEGEAAISQMQQMLRDVAQLRERVAKLEHNSLLLSVDLSRTVQDVELLPEKKRHKCDNGN